MSRFVARGLLVACIIALPLCMPSTASATDCLSRLLPWNWGRSPASETTYAPPYQPGATYAPSYQPGATYAQPACPPTVACNPCAPQASTTQVCSYVPQTCYRTVYRTVPTTTCQATTGCDPCTGCPVVTYRPVTVYRRCAQLIPYTTYRMVWSNPCATSCYSPCATSCSPCTTSYSPCGTACGVGYGISSYNPAVSVGSGSGCCGVPPAMPTTAPLSPTPATGSTGAPITFAPSNNAQPNNGTPLPSQQQRNKPVDTSVDNPGLGPVKQPEIDQKSMRTMPSLGNPDKTASRQVRPVQYVSDGRVKRRPITSSGKVDFGGWRSSRD